MIIGAGMSGLAAGIRLAHYGKKVLILERHSIPGGLNSYYRRGGYDLDVGLHAMTNYVPKAHPKLTPFLKILRQLRFKHEDFGLFPQKGSLIRFPGKQIRFTNDFEFFRAEVHSAFPSQKDNFEKLVGLVNSYDELNLDSKPLPARETVSGIVSDPLLCDMLFCPLSFYGSADEGDMEFGQFVIMFKSIFMEGFCRPYEGVRRIIKLLEDRYRERGGELRYRSAVKTIVVAGSRATAVVLDSGETIEADRVLSSAGLIETMGLCSDASVPGVSARPGELSFTETILVARKMPSEYGHEHTIIFYCDFPKFEYRKPREIVDYSSGVICCPDNFEYDRPLSAGMLRVTNIANSGAWESLARPDYLKAKETVRENALRIASKHVPGFPADGVVFHDVFTPATVRRFTGHINGAVYGTPDKSKNGATRVENLFICGTDQGFLGIIGAVLSGISIANLHFLMRSQ